MKNSDETDKLSAKNMLQSLKTEKMKFGMRESKHAMMFGGTNSLKSLKKEKNHQHFPPEFAVNSTSWSKEC